MEKPTRHGCRRFALIGLIALISICVFAAAASGISNSTLPEPPDDLERLTASDRARIEEAFHLKDQLGDDVWPGWGSMPIPLLIWNEEYAFLYGMEAAPDSWETLSDETYAGLPVFRKAGTEELQAFTEQLTGEQWVGAVSTKWEIDHFLRSQIEDSLPGPLAAVVPYRVFMLSSEAYITAMVHETFHAYQATTVRDRFDDAETAYHFGDAYAEAAEGMRAAWSSEMSLLSRALNAKTDEEAQAAVRQFLDARQQRRADTNLSEDLIGYEQRYEWLEGLAKYVEIGIYERAAQTAAYEPVEAIGIDTEFSAYRTFNQRWQQEKINMLTTATQPGDVRFYYAGMAEARLLDRWMPDWKERIMHDGVWLEELLAQALNQ